MSMLQHILFHYKKALHTIESNMTERALDIGITILKISNYPCNFIAIYILNEQQSFKGDIYRQLDIRPVFKIRITIPRAHSAVYESVAPFQT